MEKGFGPIPSDFVVKWAINDQAAKMKVVTMVSRFSQGLNDLLCRWRNGVLPIDILVVISNHTDYQKVVVKHDIPLHCKKAT
ncbi:hypothetical protein [Pseudorhodobacter wandonensis]|uniref:hypothetical protein n=1 Tax=Pseudorhodobacter wandonensis TaxID=1120568 RepID=UPI000A4918A1|nr:hypothetical protein [Pseudorhodobacter wandonensis]